jgi:amino acid transporter
MGTRLRRLLLGQPRDLRDQRLFHRLSLVPFLAWVGLGADGLSSSAYGPEEAFRALGEQTYLAPALALLMAGTVLLIGAAYRRIIEAFPTGGGGYVVVTRLVGARAGLVSGSALLVDYVLTITTSLAAAGDALFSFLPPAWHGARLPLEIALTLLLTTLNIRGVRESVLALLPIFVVFLVTHAIVIGAGLVGHLPEMAQTAASVSAGYRDGLATLGAGGLALVFMRAYSLGGGTYTGIEAVSNGLPIMREPRVRTGKRTMAYMAVSLALTASGLLFCYLLWQVRPVEGRTMNAVLIQHVMGDGPLAGAFVVTALLSEALLLVVAAQAGFLDGPRVLATMAVDSWVPRRFAALSERLTTGNGIVLMGGAALVALLYTRGEVSHLIVMYSINVFVTFSLSMFAMLRSTRRGLFAAGFVLCVTILGITLFEKFFQGGWVTVVVTALLVAVCALVRRHYRAAEARVDRLYRELDALPQECSRSGRRASAVLDPGAPTAVVLVGAFGGVGIHTVLHVFRAFPGHFRNLVFLSVGVLDSGDYKGDHAVDRLRRRTEEVLDRYLALAATLGVPATARLAVGTDVLAEAERLCLEAARDLPRATFFAGKLIFERERWWHWLLHNGTPEALQRRLQWKGHTMVTLPIRVRDAAQRPENRSRPGGVSFVETYPTKEPPC